MDPFPCSAAFRFLAPLASLASCVAVPAIPAEDGELRIAVVDMVEVFEAHPEAAEASARLTEAREKQREEFKELSNDLKKILQDHQELIRAGKRDEAEEALKEANEAEKRIATLGTKGRRDLEEKFRRAKAAIMDGIRAAVEKVNAKGEFTLVLDISSSSSNGLPQVLHAPGAEDITERVIEQVAKDHETSSEKGADGADNG